MWLLAKLMAADVVALDGKEIPTALEGQSLKVTVKDGKVFLNETTEIIITDIETANGVIHVIDAVLLPPTDEMTKLDIVDTAVADGRFTTLVAAVTAAGLVDTLKGEGPFTVFAPTDDAFAALPEGTVEALLADIPTLTNILLYHVAPGKLMAADVVALDGMEIANCPRRSELESNREGWQGFPERYDRDHHHRYRGCQWCDPRDQRSSPAPH